jgi:RES domain-containing protein
VRLWRISDFADLSGAGGVQVPGRWHPRGHWIVYLADHPASALLEVLAHLDVDPRDLPRSYQLLCIEVADDIRFGDVIEGDLDPNWRAKPDETQARGLRWLSEGATALLRVPSVIVPYAWNWLLNPKHTDIGGIRITEALKVNFDPRLLS